MNLKRILAAVLLFVLAIAPVTAMAAYTETGAQVAASTYKPRLTAPSYSNKYYYSNNNIFYSIGYGMPNCTAYAWGRAYELLGTQPKLSVDSAHYWYDYNKDHNYYPYGKTPKLGAIACWDNPYGGHVAVVEKITSTTVTLSHSEWAGRSFFLTEHAVGAPNGGAVSSGWKFEGYIYILDGEILPDGDIYRVNSSNGLNLRKGAGTKYSALTAIPDKTDIVVTDTRKADGYTWGKTTYGGYTGWCVLNFCKLVYKLPEKPAAPPATTPETEPETAIPLTTATVDELPGDMVTLPTLQARPDTWGDVSNDGKTNVSDATMLQKHIAGITTSIVLQKADVNGDGKVTVADATYIQKVIAGLDVADNKPSAQDVCEEVNL